MEVPTVRTLAVPNVLVILVPADTYASSVGVIAATVCGALRGAVTCTVLRARRRVRAGGGALAEAHARDAAAAQRARKQEL